MYKLNRRELEQVYRLKRELRMWQDRRSELEADIAPPIKQITGMPFANTNAVNSPTEEKAIRLAETAKIIDGKIAEIKIAITEVERFILSLEDSYLRQILEMRCIQSMKWADIARAMGEGYTPEAVRVSYFRFVRTLKEGQE